MLEYQYHNPFRKVEWRWLRAGASHSDPDAEPIHARFDGGQRSAMWLRKARNYIKARDACKSDVDFVKLSRKRPAIFWAHKAYEDRSASRWAIEASLLARETDEEIAFRTGCAVETVTAYEALFFNVRPKLNNQHYIVNCVVGPAVHEGVSGRQYDLLWKLCAYMCGPYVLDMLITKFPEMSWAAGPDSVSSAWQDMTVGVMKMKAAMAALTVPVNHHTHLALLDVFNKYVEIERTTDAQSEGKEAILENVQVMLQGLPFSVAGRTDHSKQMTAFYDSDGAELRYEELLLGTLGMKPQNDRLLSHMAFEEEESDEAVE